MPSSPIRGPVESLLKAIRGVYHIQIPVAGTRRHKWVTTGETDRAKALSVVLEYGVDRIIHLARARALTASAISVATIGQRTSCRELFGLWKQHLVVSVAPRTAETYGMHVSSFLESRGLWQQPVAYITEQMLWSWFNDGICGFATATSRRAAVKSYLAFCQNKGVVPGNAAEIATVDHRQMNISQLEKRLVRPMTEEQYLAVLALPRLKDHWRDWTILAYCCGYRMSDCVFMEWASFTRDWIVVYPQKARAAKRVAIPLNDPLIVRPELRALIDRLAVAERQDPVHIWPEFRADILGGRRTKFSVAYMRVLQRAKVEGCSFHSLRRACAVRLKNAGRSMEDIAASLGHESTATTAVYVDSEKNLP